MKFFLDTADLAEIEEAASWGVLAGVTTNPTLYARVGGRLADFPDHIKRICRSYKAQLDAMLSELSTFPEGTTYTRPDGGLFIFVTLPEGIDAKVLLEQAVERHVAYVPGTHFFCDGGHENTLRLNFSNSSIAQIHEGMSTLREIFAQALVK